MTDQEGRKAPTSEPADSIESVDGSWRFFAGYAVVGPLALSIIALLRTGAHPAVLWLYVTLALAAGLLCAITFAIEGRGALPAISRVADRWSPSGNDWYFVVLGTIGFLLASVPLFVSAPSLTPIPAPVPGVSVHTPFVWSTGALIAGVVAGLIGVIALVAGGTASLRRRRASVRALTSPTVSAGGNGDTAAEPDTLLSAYQTLLKETKTEYDSASQATYFWGRMNVGLAFSVALLSGAAGITSIISGTPSSVRLIFAVLGILGAALAALSVSIAAGQRHGAMASRTAQLRAFRRNLTLQRLDAGEIKVAMLKNNAAQFEQIMVSTDPDVTADARGNNLD